MTVYLTSLVRTDYLPSRGGLRDEQLPRGTFVFAIYVPFTETFNSARSIVPKKIAHLDAQLNAKCLVVVIRIKS